MIWGGAPNQGAIPGAAAAADASGGTTAIAHFSVSIEWRPSPPSSTFVVNETTGAPAAQPYPTISNPSASLISGMVGAYFPGYGPPLRDATGTWLALTPQAGGTAGVLTANSLGKAMAFDGLYNGLWATGSGMPLASATAMTIATVFQVNGLCHNFGAIFGAYTASSVQNRLTLAWDTDPVHVSSPLYGKFYINPDVGNISNSSLFATSQVAMSTPVIVALITLDFAGLSASLYINGTLNGSPLTLLSGTGMSGVDTVAFGCRVTATSNQSPFTFTSGSNVAIGPSGNEDIFVGCPVTDTAGVLPAGTVMTAYDGGTRYTFSNAATGNASGDTVNCSPPFTRFMNGTVNAGFYWNRILTGTEITSFSASPFANFNMP